MTPAESIAATKPARTHVTPGRPVRWVCRARAARQALGLTLEDVATGTGLSLAGVCQIERGADPRLSTARRLAAFYGRTVEELWPERVGG